MAFNKLILPSVGADYEEERPKPVVSCWAQRSIWLPIERSFAALRMTSDPRWLPILVV